MAISRRGTAQDLGQGGPDIQVEPVGGLGDETVSLRRRQFDAPVRQFSLQGGHVSDPLRQHQLFEPPHEPTLLRGVGYRRCAPGSGAAAVPVAGRVAGAALSDMRLCRSRVHLSSRVEAVGFAHVNRAQRSVLSPATDAHILGVVVLKVVAPVPVVVVEALGIVVVGVFEHLMCDRLG